MTNYQKKAIQLTLIICIISFILFNLISCCFPFERKPRETRTNIESDKIAEKIDKNFINNNSDFALKIFKELSSESETSSVFFSPLSISLAAAMIYNGAENKTATEISDTFMFSDGNIEALNESFKNLQLSLENIDEMVQLYLANSIWLRNEFNSKTIYTDIIQNSYNASVNIENFSDANTVNKINDWVSDATKHKITNIVDSSILANSVMILISAIYFKGQWKEKFKVENTIEDDFYLIDKNIKKVQMMQNAKKFDYYEESDFQMTRMPYGRDKTAMYILLPKESVELNGFLKNLSVDLLNQYIAGLENREVTVKFPKFNLQYSTRLNEPLKNLGMLDAFSEEVADFDKIAPELFMSTIDHKAIIEVNEEGTVAAAATSFGMGATAVEPVSFIVNRPFIIFILDDRTGSILFAGKIMEP